MGDGRLDDIELKISHEIVERCKNLSLKHKVETSTDPTIDDLKKQMNTLAENIKGLRT